MNKRVVITGVGIVSSIGMGVDAFWGNLLAGKSGISEVELFDTTEYPYHKAGQIKSFQPEKYIDKDKIRDLSRASQFAVVASLFALKDAGINKKSIKSVTTIVGTTMANVESLEQIDKHWLSSGEDDIWAKNVRQYPGFNLANSIGYYLGLKGRTYTIPTACAAGNYCIGLGFDLIRRGKSDIVIAGGADPLGRTNFTGFSRLVAMAPELCQPFDKNRKGMMVGEGAGILIIESLERAEARGARIYAEIIGYGLSCDAQHMTIPSGVGIKKVMLKAMREAGIKPDDVDYICAHGTGTPANDRVESQAIKDLFGEKHRDVAVSSIKSMLGHTMGAASAIEAVACCLSIKEGQIPPTINFSTPDPDCDIDCVPNKARKKDVKVVLNNSFAFGGNNACVVLRAVCGR